MKDNRITEHRIFHQGGRVDARVERNTPIDISPVAVVMGLVIILAILTAYYIF